MIEKMLEKFEELRMRYFLTIANGGDEKLDFAYGYVGKTIDQCKEIVQEVAKEYDEFDVIYKKVCELEKQYAKCAEDWKNVNGCIRLENLLQYFKEQLKAPVQKGEQKKAFNEEKCRTARHFAACADSYCSDNCNMQCPHEKGE